MGEISGGSYVVRPIVALICGEDCPHFRVWGHMAQSKGVRMHEFPHQISDRGNTHEIMKWFYWGHFEDPGELTKALILGDLHAGD